MKRPPSDKPVMLLALVFKYIYKYNRFHYNLPFLFKIRLQFITEDFPGDPVVNILHFQCRGHEFNPWSGN